MFFVPLRSRFEEAGAGREVRTDNFLVQCDTKAWFVGDGNESSVDNGFVDTFDQVLPPGNVERVIFASEKILSRGRAVNAGVGADGQARIVHRHRDTVFHGHVADFVRLEECRRR